MIEFYAIHHDHQGTFRFWSISRDSVITPEVHNVVKTCGVDTTSEDSLNTLIDILEFLGVSTSLQKLDVRNYINNCRIITVIAAEIRLKGEY